MGNKFYGGSKRCCTTVKFSSVGKWSPPPSPPLPVKLPVIHKFHADGQTNTQTDMTTPIVPCRNFADAPKYRKKKADFKGSSHMPTTEPTCPVPYTSVRIAAYSPNVSTDCCSRD